MRVFIFVITILATTFAAQLLSSGDIEALFRKNARDELSAKESHLFNDVLEILRRPRFATFSDLERLSPLRMSIECLVCRSAFATAFEGVALGQTDDEIVGVITGLCVKLGIATHNVCYGVAKLNVPIIAHIIRTTPEASPSSFCGHIFQTATNPNNCRVNDPRFEWTVHLPPPATPATPKDVDTSPLKIALITDAHIDPLYEAYGVAQCNEPTCCRKGQIEALTSIAQVADDDSLTEKVVVDVNGELKYDVEAASDLKLMRNSSLPKRHPPAGYWGDYRNCDTPKWAFDDVIHRVAGEHKDIDMVYYIGDTIDHHIWETTYELVDEMHGYLIEEMRSSFDKNVLIVPIIGNHESQPTNQFAPSRVTEENLNTTWLYDSLAEKWHDYLTDDAKKTFKDKGVYSMIVKPGLRVIAINTMVAYKFNWWLSYDPLDAKTHLEWLVNELHGAESRGERVHLLSHIPPGVADLTHTWTREFNKIVNRFSATIAAEFNGHTHADEFRIYFNPEGKAINVAWGGGGATAHTFNNLNYKIVELNSNTFEPSRILSYVYNLTEANLTPHRKPHWFKLYEMKNTFGLADLSAESIYDLVRRMVTTDKDLFEIYMAFYPKLSDSYPDCNTDCKLERLCDTVVTVLWERHRCEELVKLYKGV